MVVTIEKVSVAASDIKRAGVLQHLSESEHSERFSELKKHVEPLIRQKISDGSFRWHLERLKAEDLIEDDREGRYKITELGKEVAALISESLAEVVRIEELPEPVSDTQLMVILSTRKDLYLHKLFDIEIKNSSFYIKFDSNVKTIYTPSFEPTFPYNPKIANIIQPINGWNYYMED